MSGAAEWVERAGTFTATVHGCRIEIERLGETWQWRVALGQIAGAAAGLDYICDYASAHKALEATKLAALREACDLAERSGLAAALRERDALRERSAELVTALRDMVPEGFDAQREAAAKRQALALIAKVPT